MSTDVPGRDHDAPDAGEPAPLDRYLDGLMDAQEARAFEQSLENDPAQRRQVELQRSINASLRAMFTPPESIPVPGAGAGVEPAAHERAAMPLTLGPGPAGRRRVLRIAALAATLALMAAGGAAYWWMFIGDPAPFRQPAQIYQAQAAAGFTPEWVCTTDDEFRATVRERFGQGALLPLATQGVQIVGWAYNTPVLSNRTATLITRVQGQDVLVLIDRADRDVNLRRTGEAGQRRPLNLFKRRLGDLVLYEVSPLDHAAVIPGFVLGE